MRDFLPFYAMFEARVRTRPELLAVSTPDRTMSYGQLQDRVQAVRAGLRQLGLRRGDVVAVVCERTPDLVAAALAVWSAGMVYLPVDAGAPAPYRTRLLSESHPDLVLTERLLAGIAQTAVACPSVSVRPEDPAYLIYTSGTTGSPKGVIVPHRGLSGLAVAQSRVLDIHPGDRVLQYAPVTFDASIAELTLALAHGASLHVHSRDELLPGPALATTLADQRITHAILVPSVLAELTPAKFPALRLLGVAGEPCPAHLAAAWSDLARLVNLYGVTECSVWSTYAELSGAPAGQQTPPIGKPVHGTSIRIVQSTGGVAADGESGELLIGGDGVGLGYRDRADLTSDSFVVDERGNRFYRTGDVVARRPDGQLVFLGRLDDQVQIRGQRVELSAVEAALLTFPGIARAVAFTGGSRLLVCVLPREGARIDTAALRHALAGAIPASHVPSRIVVVNHIPLTAHGKADRVALRELVATQSSRVQPARTSDPLTAEIIDLLGQVLPIAPATAEENFFTLGGDSLAAARLITRVHEIYGVSIRLRDFFTEPTAAALANHIASHQLVP